MPSCEEIFLCCSREGGVMTVGIPFIVILATAIMMSLVPSCFLSMVDLPAVRRSSTLHSYASTSQRV